MAYSLFSLLLLVLPVAASVAAGEQTTSSQWTVGQGVQTTSGFVKGHGAPIRGFSTVSEYLGIPFAESTAGKNRFMKPVRLRGNGTIDATEYALGCPAIRGVTKDLSSEDCLAMNVWTMPQVGEKKKAVLLWIFGGGFAAGDSSDPGEVGAKFAKQQDVVIVSFNYRNNIFGFPGAPNLPDMNPGILDMRMAVEWTRDNIENFGGDPSRITLFGESAGGTGVDYYAYLWRHDPIVAGFIEQSGSIFISGPFTPPSAEYRNGAWYNTSKALGCGGEEKGYETVKCVQTKSIKQILAAMPPNLTGFMSTVGHFGPTYDDITVFRDPYKLGREGKFIQRPMLGGTNHNESAAFTLLGGVWLGSETEIALNVGFRCGMADATRARVMHNVPVWRYHYAGNYPGFNIGAAHAQEITSLFTGGDGVGGTMQKAWAAFAKDPEQGLSKLGWPRYDAKGKTLVRLGYNMATEPDFVDAKAYDYQCPPSRL